MKAFNEVTKSTALTADAILRNSEKAEAHVIAYYNDMLAAEGLEVMGDTTAEVVNIPRVKSDANAERYAAAGYLRSEMSANGSEKRKGTSEEPTTCLANSMGDPELLGLYVATPKAAATATLLRATHCIESLVLTTDGRRKGEQTNSKGSRARKAARQAKLLERSLAARAAKSLKAKV
jgi:hypothetical protein